MYVKSMCALGPVNVNVGLILIWLNVERIICNSFEIEVRNFLPLFLPVNAELQCEIIGIRDANEMANVIWLIVPYINYKLIFGLRFS